MKQREIKFRKFLKDNWSELVKEAEESTGEKYDGPEPLLTKDMVIEFAKEKYKDLLK